MEVILFLAKICIGKDVFMGIELVCQQLQRLCRLIPIAAVLVHIDRSAQFVEHQDAVFFCLCYNPFTLVFFFECLHELLSQFHVLQFVHRLVHITLFVEVEDFLHFGIEFALVDASHRVSTVTQVVHDTFTFLFQFLKTLLIVGRFLLEGGDLPLVTLGNGLKTYIVVVLLANIEVLLIAHDERKLPLKGGPLVHLFFVEHNQSLAERLFLEGQFLSCPEVLKLYGKSAIRLTDGRTFGIRHCKAHIGHRILRFGLIVIQIRDALLGVGFRKKDGCKEQRDTKGKYFLHHVNCIYLFTEKSWTKVPLPMTSAYLSSSTSLLNFFVLNFLFIA